MKKEELLEELDAAKGQLEKFNEFSPSVLLADEEKSQEFKWTLIKLSNTVMRLQILVQAQNLKEVAHPTNAQMEHSRDTGRLVAIRPCGEEYGNKTYLGIYIGNVATGSSMGITEDKIQLNFALHNPAIFVPELKRVIYGMESYWYRLNSEEELKGILDADIENVWYVQALREIESAGAK